MTSVWGAQLCSQPPATIAKRSSISHSRRTKLESHAEAAGSSVAPEALNHWDLAAFEQALRHCESRAYRLAVQLVRDESVARDILQETLPLAWDKLPLVSDREQIQAWAYRAVLRACIAHIERSETAAHQLSDDHSFLFMITARRFCMCMEGREASDSCDNDPTRWTNLCHRLQEVVDALPSGLRTTFILCELEETPIADLAEIMGQRPEEVRDELEAARLSVRQALLHEPTPSEAQLPSP